MTIEDIAKDFINRSLSRRSLLQEAGATTLLVAAEGARVSGQSFNVLKGAQEIALSTPKSIPSPNSEYEIYPGSLEAVNDAPLIDPYRQGFLRFFRNVVFKNSIVTDTARASADILSEMHRGNNSRLRPSDIIRTNIEQAAKRLKAVDRSTIDPKTNLDVEAARIGLFGAAAYTLPWLNQNELKALRIIDSNVPPEQSVTKIVWGMGGVGRDKYPRFFGAKGASDPIGQEPSEQGQDRSMHVFSHALLTFLHSYYDYYGIDQGKTIPAVLQAYINFQAFRRAERSILAEAVDFSFISGLAYEASTTIKPYEAYQPGRSVKGGMLAEDFNWDMKANALGARLGTAMFYLSLIGESTNPLLAELNDLRFSVNTTKPEFKTIQPEMIPLSRAA